jgi:PTS system mannose-specific IIA component
MIGVLVVTHGRLAEELLAATERITGRLERFRALSLDWSEGLDAANERIRTEIRALDDGDGVLLLTDMFGDTPSNAALACCEEGRVEIVSGVNLPMMVRLGCSGRGTATLPEMARWLEIKGRQSIRRVSGGGRGPQPAGERGGD